VSDFLGFSFFFAVLFLLNPTHVNHLNPEKMIIQEPEKFLVRMLMRQNNIVSFNFNGIVQLAEIINKSSEETVSANTLARIAGIRTDSRKTYKHTLDVLAKHALYNTYDQFTQFLHQKSRLRLSNEKENFEPFLYDYTRKAATNGDISFLKELFNHIETNGCSVNDVYMISGALAEGLRNNRSPKSVIRLLANSNIGIELFFENHVDRDYFNGYYGASMVEVSKHLNEKDHLFLFSNAIALHYEKSIGDQVSLKKRGKKLMEIEDIVIDEMTKIKLIYPVARWIAATADYLYTISDKKGSTKIIEKIIELAPSLSPDERMILLSECSEIAAQMHSPLLAELKNIYLENKSKVLVEFDSLCNAGLNLNIHKKQPVLISRKEIQQYLIRYPFQFAMCRDSLAKKMRPLSS
jgi:hypothetical protein